MPCIRQRGFTLIELLVVIAIIAVLAAILFPVFARAREKAMQSNCLSNQRQLAVSLLVYTNDHDEALPLPSDWAAATGLASDTTVFDCPSSSKPGNPGNPDYGMNAYLFTTDNSGQKTELSMGEVTNPEEIELLCDLARPSKKEAASDTNPFPNTFTINGAMVNTDRRHPQNLVDTTAGGLVMAYLDGHVEYLKGTEKLGSRGGPYNLTRGQNVRKYIDFSSFKDAASAQTAFSALFGTYNYPGVLQGSFTGDSWTIPANGHFMTNDGVGGYGMTIMIDYESRSRCIFYHVNNASHYEANIASVDPAAGYVQCGALRSKGTSDSDYGPLTGTEVQSADQGLLFQRTVPDEVELTVSIDKKEDTRMLLKDGSFFQTNGWSPYYKMPTTVHVRGKGISLDWTGTAPCWAYQSSGSVYIDVLQQPMKLKKIFISY